jgi:hypothetical protein
MYCVLDPDKTVETSAQLKSRIEDRFPVNGLADYMYRYQKPL